MTSRIDLHTHSTCSDGTLTPSGLARYAKKAELSAIALTDHDNISGIPEFMSECERLGIEGIPGIEISVEYRRQLHIVGLYDDGANKPDVRLGVVSGGGGYIPYEYLERLKEKRS